MRQINDHGFQSYDHAMYTFSTIKCFELNRISQALFSFNYMTKVQETAYFLARTVSCEVAKDPSHKSHYASAT